MLIRLIKIDPHVEQAHLCCDATRGMNHGGTVQTKAPIGLDGVPAAETALSHVDGEKGELIIDGERVDDLIRHTSFEGVTARLWSAATLKPIT